jgi:hypothetical protein
MIGLSRAECHRHRESLLEFADHRDVAAVDVASLEHLDRCDDCRREVEAAALTIIALHRLAPPDGAVPAADVWPRLRARVLARPPKWRWRTPLAGLLVSAGLVALVLAPAAYFRPPPPYIQEVGVEPAIYAARRAVEDRNEASLRELQLAVRAQPVPHDPSPADGAAVAATWYGPDGLFTLELQAPAAQASLAGDQLETRR